MAQAYLVMHSELFYNDEYYTDYTDDTTACGDPRAIFFDPAEAERHARHLQRQEMRGQMVYHLGVSEITLLPDELPVAQLMALVGGWGVDRKQVEMLDFEVPEDADDATLDALADLVGLQLFHVIPAVVGDTQALHWAQQNLAQLRSETGSELALDEHRAAEILTLFGREYGGLEG